MADFMKMLQQAQQMQGKLQQMQEEMERLTLTATSGGGMVTATADGKGQIKRIQIDPSVVSAADVEMLEDLVLVAITEVQKKAATAAQEEMQKVTGGLSLPFKMPF
jgi:DNA-binding YbaB/EbfC family protein